jgi:parallel beta-helix repeat protein
MATWYIATTGNDSTGNGTIGNPWATFTKAITNNASLAAGDMVLPAAGTYAENNSGAFLLNKTFSATNPVIVQPQVANTTVTITGTSGSTDFIIGNCGGFRFNNINFAQYGAGSTQICRFSGNATVGLYFYQCNFTITSTSSHVNYAFSSAITTGTTGVTNITWDTCTITATDYLNQTRGIQILNVDGTTPLDSLTIKNCSITTGATPITLSGATNVSVSYNVCTALLASAGGYGIIIGYDSHTATHATTGTAWNNIVNTAGGHGMLVGGSTTTVTYRNNRVYGGNTTSAGQGIVIKGCTGCTVEFNFVQGGLNSGIYLKGATANTVAGNISAQAFSSFNYSAALRLGIDPSDPTDFTCTNNAINYNTFIQSGAGGAMIYWEPSTGDGGGNVSNNNQYLFVGSGTTWGTIYGNTTAGQTLSALRTAWASAPVSEQGNDAASTLYGTASVVSYQAATTGSYLYYTVTSDAGQLWNGSGFVTPGSVDYGTLTFPLSEFWPGSYVYCSALIQTLPAGRYTLNIYKTTSGVANLTDTLQATQTLDWSGAARASTQAVQTTVNGIAPNAATAATQSTLAATESAANGTAIAALPTAATITAAVFAATIDGTITMEQCQALQLAIMVGKYETSTVAGVTVTRYYRQDDSLLATSTLNTVLGTTTRTWVFTNLP